MISTPVFAGDVYVTGKVGRVDSVTGPGNSVVQHPDRSATYYYRDGARRESTSGKKEQFFDFSCADWNDERKNETLIFDKDTLVLETRDAYILTVYIRGLLDAHKLPFDETMMNEIDANCAKHTTKEKLDTVVSRMKSWWRWL